MAGDVPFYAKNGVIANLSFIANATQTSLGANINITPSQITILSSTSNITINSTALFVGNSTVNTTVNSSYTTSLQTNVNAQYVWTNTHTFQTNVTFSGGTVNASAANVASQTLTDGATVNWNIQNGQIATLTLGGNRTMAAPTNLVVGTFILHVLQDGTGSRTITWNSVFKWVQATAPVLSTTANRHDICTFICDGTNLYGTFIPDLR